MITYKLMQGDTVLMSNLDYDSAFDFFVMHGSFSNKDLHIERES